MILPRAWHRAAATEALHAVLLVSRDRPCQREPAIKGQMRDRRKEHPFGVLASKIEFADDPAFVARIVDLCDPAAGRQIEVRRLLLQQSQHGRTDRRGKGQGRSQLGDELLNLGGIVDHEWLSTGSRRGVLDLSGFPGPGQELVDALGRVIGQALQNIGQPRVWVDVIELRGLDQGVDRGRTPTPRVRARKDPILAPDGDAASARAATSATTPVDVSECVKKTA